MKKLFVVVFLLFAVSSHSQVLISLVLGDKLNSEGLEFGLEGGWNFSSISDLETNDRKSNFNLGFYFDISLQPKSQWSFYTGMLMKSSQGIEGLTANDLSFLGVTTRPESGDYKQVLKSFMLPTLIKYSFEKNIYLEGGVQYVWNYDAYVEFNSDINGVEIRERDNNKDAINWFDVGLVGGTGYQFQKWSAISVGVKYYYGLLDIYKEESGQKSNSIFLKINIPIGIKKTAKDNKKKQDDISDTP